MAEVDVVVDDPGLYRSIPKHGVYIFFRFAIKELFLTSIESKLNLTCLIEAQCAVEGQRLAILIGGLRTQKSEPSPRVKETLGYVIVTEVVCFAGPHLENGLV